LNTTPKSKNKALTSVQAQYSKAATPDPAAIILPNVGIHSVHEKPPSLAAFSD
jgi:hypothetical protein